MNCVEMRSCLFHSTKLSSSNVTNWVILFFDSFVDICAWITSLYTTMERWNNNNNKTIAWTKQSQFFCDSKTEVFRKHNEHDEYAFFMVALRNAECTHSTRDMTKHDIWRQCDVHLRAYVRRRRWRLIYWTSLRVMKKMKMICWLALSSVV